MKLARNLTLLLLLLNTGTPLLAQTSMTPSEYAEKRAQAMTLYKENKMVDAVPLFEQLHAVQPNDAGVTEGLAFSTFAIASTVENKDEGRKMRLRARALAEEAKKRGDKGSLLDTILDAVPEDGNEAPAFSRNKEVDAAMRAGENAFTRGDFKGALEGYALALRLDPNNYAAALFTGDVYFRQNQLKTAGEWFGRAIKIDPDRETAYRYWGDALMQDGKMSEARDKFVDAIIAEPYERHAWIGLQRWGDKSHIDVGHPLIDTPAEPRRKPDGNVEITIDAQALLNPNDGSSAWLAYSIVRTTWLNEKFLATFPKEKTYRHSLAEEAAALRAAAEVLSQQIKDKKMKKEGLSTSLTNLLKLHDVGLIEAYVLLAAPDEGIADDYESYRSDHRDELRRYLTDYVAN